MKKLGMVDVGFLLTERREMPMHVGSVNLFTLPKDADEQTFLRELAENSGVTAHLIDEAGQIEDAWLQGKQAVGVTAGASAPEELVTGVIEKLRARGVLSVDESQGKKEPVTFSLPGELKKANPDGVG